MFDSDSLLPGENNDNILVDNIPVNSVILSLACSEALLRVQPKPNLVNKINFYLNEDNRNITRSPNKNEI